MDVRKLKNPPINEAVIEFQFQPDLDFDKDFLDKVKSKFESEYPTIQFIKSKEFKLDLEKISDQPAIDQGIVLKNQEKGIILNFNKNRLSISKLKPYSNFDELQDTLIHFIAQINFVTSSNISRIGVRYINEIQIKNDYKDLLLYDLLIANPFNSKEIKSLYNQYILEHDDSDGTIVNTLINIREKKLVIDIDSFTRQIYKLNNLVELEDILNKLRYRKNNIFFSLVTDSIEDL